MDRATDKQVGYAKLLLEQGNWPTGNMDPGFRRLGATTKQCLGRVDTWLRSMTKQEISKLIDELKQGG